MTEYKMPPRFTTLIDGTRLAFDTLGDRASDLLNPVIRLGVTGLSRSGKTVFISSLVQNLLHSGRLPLFEPYQSGRISSVRLEPQPDDAVPRFQYEDHIQALVEERLWPQSTRAISQLRLTLDYESSRAWNSFLRPRRLLIDIVDYPGEWLLDLPLLNKDYKTFSQETIALAKSGIRSELSQSWLQLISTINGNDALDETTAQSAAASFTAYLQACKTDERSLSTLPPGRFLMPGDLEGSPALTFTPLLMPDTRTSHRNSIWDAMERRYEAYKKYVVKPFFRNHFARIDRQIVLIDALQAIHSGSEAVQDLEKALSDVLACFRPGKNSFLSSLMGRRVDKVLIAATKADHLPHEDHPRLDALTRRLVQNASQRININGADIEVMALASVRATREGTVTRQGETLPVITGTPLANETIASETFDGLRQTAVFPGDLPKDLRSLFKPDGENSARHPINIVRFRPPVIAHDETGKLGPLPHIRLDQAMQFLFGDKLS